MSSRVDGKNFVGVGEIAILTLLVLQVKEEWEGVCGRGASPKLREFADESGFAGATDELKSFLHSAHFECLLDAADVDYEKALRALNAEKTPDCLCESCTHTEEVEYMLDYSNPFYSIARTVTDYERKRGNTCAAGQERGGRSAVHDAGEGSQEPVSRYL